MKRVLITQRFAAAILALLTMSCALIARGQQNNSRFLSDADKAEIVESVLQLEIEGQALEFENIRKVSSNNIGFIQASRISQHGFSLVTATQIFSLKKDVVQYVVFRRIAARDGVVVVSLARVTEGRSCFGSISRERRYTYEYQNEFGKWIGHLVIRPLELSFERNTLFNRGFQR